ncbi:MAG: hypothetical protein CMO80_22595 [Verrucomicrobiales bacterium]|nr:hypothetical protein [Verrucomicrobiales bacterium]
MNRHTQNPKLALIAFTSILLASCNPQTEVSRGVELRLSTREFRADSYFELRFEEDMVPFSAIGTEAMGSPLHIQPMLKGRFVWLSPRSGAYTPSEAPMLNTTYLFRLSSGLQQADGRASPARLLKRLRTPDFEITDLQANYHRTNDVPSKPRILVEFNSAVVPESLTPFCRFTNGDRNIAAIVTAQTNRAKHSSPMRWAIDDSGNTHSRSWREQFDYSFRNREATNTPALESSREDPPQHLVAVQPAVPLPEGEGWKLTFDAGLPAKSKHLSLMKLRDVLLGSIRFVEVTDAHAMNIYERGKYIQLVLSKSLHWRTTQQRLKEWITVKPPVENLRVQKSYRSILVYGDFVPKSLPYERVDKYQIRLDPRGTSASQGGEQPIRAFKGNVKFKPLVPQVRFPKFETSKSFTGSDAYPVLAINADRVRLSAKKLTPETLIHVLRGYGGHYRSWRNRRTHAIPFGVVPGIELLPRQLHTRSPLDEPVRVPLNLSELLDDKPGPIFLHATPSGWRGAPPITQGVVQLTDLGAIWKHHAHGASVFVFSHRSGKPLANARVSIHEDDSHMLVSTRTDGNGIAHFQHDSIISQHPSSKRRWLMIRNGDDVHALDFSKHQLSRWGFGINTYWDTETENIPTLFSFSDRTAYRPGETAHFKVIGRIIGNELEDWPINPDQRAEFNLYDPRGRVIAQTTNKISNLGSSHWSVELPRDRPGRYRMRARMPGATTSQIIQVQAFKPDAFEVRLSQPRIGFVGDDIALDLSANYYLGKELSRAKVQWTATANEFRPTLKGLDGFVFGKAHRHYRLREVLRRGTHTGRGEYSSGSNFVIAPRLFLSGKSASPRRVTVRASVTDQNQQTVSSDRQFVEPGAEFYLGLSAMDHVIPVGAKISPVVVAIDSDHNLRTNSLEATIKLFSIQWRPIAYQGAGKTHKFRNEYRLEELRSERIRTQIPTREGIKWNAPPATNEFATMDKGGHYLLEVSTEDEFGHQVVSSTDFSVSGTNRVAWDYKNPAHVQLVPDREVYRPGDRARILVKTPIEGHALVSKERNGIHELRHEALSGNAPAIEIDITTNDAPNVFASLTLVRGSEDGPKKFPKPDFRYGYCELKVEDFTRRLKIELKPEQKTYRPSANVKLAGRILDHHGQAVAGSEVTLYAVDEGILSLTAYQSPDPFAFFHRDQSLRVATHLSLPALMSENPAELEFSNKGFIAGGGGRMGKPRSNFEPCPLWLPAEFTDADGRFQAEFVAPDSLTRYRIIAIAHADKGRFGSAKTDIEVNKHLMIEPVLPAFARRGDQIKAAALLINRTKSAGRVELRWKRRGAALTKGPDTRSENVELAANETRTVQFPFEFIESGSTEWIWEASFLDGEQKGVGDSVVSKFRVEEPMPFVNEVFVGRVNSGTNLLAPVDPALLLGRGHVAVYASTSPLLQAWGATDYLLRYPYGCLEQTASSMTPWLLLHSDQTLRALSGKSRQDCANAAKKGVARILSMQTGQGGLSYWPGGKKPQLFTSAYGAMMLLKARDAGLDVPEQPLDDVLEYLRRIARSKSRESLTYTSTDFLFALYTLALADKGETGWYTHIANRAESIHPSSRALLAMSILHSFDARHWKNLARKLLNIPRPETSVRWNHFGSQARLTALELMAWRILGDADQVLQRQDKLLAGRKNGHWLNTQSDAWVLMALAGQQGSMAREIATVNVSWSDESRSIELPDGATRIEFRLDRDKQGIPMVLEHDSKVPLFAYVRVSSQLEKLPDPLRERGFQLTRQYEEVDGEGKRTPASDLETGDTVLVTLRFSCQENVGYVAIDDALPEAFTAINRAFKSRTANGQSLERTWTADFREIRDDRVLFFRNHLPKGEHQIRYLARVRAEGGFQAPPARIEEMYRPSRHGLSKPIRVESRR